VKLSPNTTRRRAILAAAALAIAVAGCGSEGFHLRVPQKLNYQRIALSGFADRSTMAAEIKRALPEGTLITPNVLDAQVVVEALVDTRDTTVEASTAFGQVRELQLHCLLRYRVLRPDGTELLKPADFERFRDLTYDESIALAKDTELNSLYQAMQSDMAVQLIRVLSALGNPTGRLARAGAEKAASGAIEAAASAAAAASAVAPAASAPSGR
jgi:LPS-assembly lipoprotein